MGLTQKFGVHQYVEAMRTLGIEIWASDGTPSENGPRTGALAVDTTNGKLYINTGTTSAAVWNEVGAITAGEITLAEGSILIGNASGVATALNAKTSGQIIVGNGTTATSVAVSGDISLSSAGVTAIGAGKVTPSMMATSQSLTSTADGTGTGAMLSTSSHAVVTSASATNQISLPASSSGLLGRTFTLYVGSNGYELITPASSNATINGADADGTNQMDVPANSLVRATLVDTNTWLADIVTAAGVSVVVPDND